MSRIVLSILLWGAAGMTALYGQAVFEGFVESRNTTTDEMGEPQRYTMTLRVKGDIIRTEISAFGSNPSSILIYRRDLGVVWVLNEKAKTFFEMRTDAQSPTGEGGQTRAASRIRRTGKTKRILGYPCDQLILRSGDAQTEYWGTKKLPALAASIARAFGSEQAEPNGGMIDEVTAMGYFPMVVRTRFEGRLIESSEVTRIDMQALPDTLFVVPPEYHKELAPDMP